MKKILIFVCWLMGYGAVAQQQVTDFENRILKFPTEAQLVDTINHKALFTIALDESFERTLWVTDGKAENTHRMKDGFGELPPDFTDKVRKYGYLYLKGPAFWRTDGSILERLTPNTGVPDRIFEVNNRLLLCISHYEEINNWNIPITSFAWLDSLNHTTVWEEDVTGYQIIDSTLHYVKLNRQKQLYELCILNKNGELTKNLITQPTQVPLTKFEYLLNSGVAYYFFNTGIGTKLVLKPANSTDSLDLKDWSNLSLFPTFVRDSANKIYFLKHAQYLTVYTLSTDNQIKEKWKLPYEYVRQISDVLNFYASVNFANWSISDNQLFFTLTLGVEGAKKYFLNRFNLQTGDYKRSRDLYRYLSEYFYSASIKSLDSDTYEVDNKHNQKIIYSFLKDSVVKEESYPLKEQMVDLKGIKTVISDNTYAVEGATRTPLIPENQVFDQSMSDFVFAQIPLDTMLIFVRYNRTCACYQLWSNKGEKKSNTLLMNLDGQFERFIDVSKNHFRYFLGKMYIQTRDYVANTVSVYITDGTPAGSKKLYKHPDGNLAFLRASDRQLVYRAYNNNGEKKLVIMGEEQEGEWRIIDIPLTRNGSEVFVTSTDTYVLVKTLKSSLYEFNELFVVEYDSLVRVDNDVSEVMVYQDKVYYSRWITEQNTIQLGLMYRDKNPLKNLPALGVYNISGFRIYGDKLVYERKVADGFSDYTIVDLTTHKTEHTIYKIKPIAILYLNGVLAVADAQKLYLVKDGKRQEYTTGFGINTLTAFNNGLLLSNAGNLTYYDLSDYQGYSIIKNKDYTAPIFSNTGTYLIFSVRNSANAYQWYYWTLSDKQLIDFEDLGEFFVLNDSQILQYNNYSAGLHVWSFTGRKFVRKYTMAYDYFNTKKQAGDNFYIPYMTEEKGTELAKIGTDSLIIYPELVVGKEGMILGDVFEFLGRVFVYAYTKTSGWQVWRMDNEPTIILGNESPIEQPLLTAYPNPTQDWLYVKTEKSLPYKLINTRGQLLMQGNLSSQHGIDIKQLPQGVYLIQLFDEGRVYVRKVVKE